MARQPYYELTITPDDSRVGEPIHPTALEEACQLLGYDPDTVLEVHLSPMRVEVLTSGGTPRRTVLHRHVVR